MEARLNSIYTLRPYHLYIMTTSKYRHRSYLANLSGGDLAALKSLSGGLDFVDVL